MEKNRNVIKLDTKPLSKPLPKRLVGSIRDYQEISRLAPSSQDRLRETLGASFEKTTLIFHVWTKCIALEHENPIYTKTNEPKM